MDIKVHNKRVVAFDLDDTLYKEIDYVRSAFSSIARKLNPETWLELYLDMFALFRERKNVFDFLLKEYNTSKQELLQHYRHHIPEIQPDRGVPELIRQIRSNKGITGIITDGRSITQKNKLSQLGLLELMDFVIISEETGHDKHQAFNFELLQKRYPGSVFTYIADNPAKDFIYPNQLGWQTIGVLDNGTHIHRQQGNLPQDNMPGAWIKCWNQIRLL